MIIYICYSTDLMEIPKDRNKEDTIGYVDDVIMIAIGNTFEETVATFKNMMEHNRGGFSWSSTHNSRFKISKVAVMHLSRATAQNKEDCIRTKCRKTAPPLIVNGDTIHNVEEYKYLEIIIDTKL